MCRKKGTHSLSNCQACASNFDSIQRTFPLKPYFQPTPLLIEASFIENEYPKFNEKCKKLIGKSFPEIAANNAKKLGLRDINGEVQKANKDTKRKCTAECNCELPIPQTSVLVGYKSIVKLYIMSLQMNQVRKRNVIHFSPISAIDLMNLLTNSEIGMNELLLLPHT